MGLQQQSGQLLASLTHTPKEFQDATLVQRVSTSGDVGMLAGGVRVLEADRTLKSLPVECLEGFRRFLLLSQIPTLTVHYLIGKPSFEDWPARVTGILSNEGVAIRTHSMAGKGDSWQSRQSRKSDSLKSFEDCPRPGRVPRGDGAALPPPRLLRHPPSPAP